MNFNAAGIVVLLVALSFAALYGHSRDRHLRITIAGGDPICVPGNEYLPVERLAAALATASVGNASPGEGPDAIAWLEKASNPSDG